MGNHFADIVGYLAGGVRMVSFVPQIVKTLRTGRADDISIPMLLLQALTAVLFILYAALMHLVPIMITLSILLAMVIAQIGLTLRFSGKRG